MAKVKYYYDTKTLNYQRIEKTTLDRVKNILIYLGVSLFSGVVMMVIFFQFFDSPNEKILIREKADLISQYDILKKNIEEINIVLQDMQFRDDNIYRVILEADPVPSIIRKAGFGGVNKYKHLENMSNSDLIIETSKQIDIISKQLYIQSKSFDEVIELAKNKTKMLSCLPSIQPISNKDLKRMVSGFGPRIHPIYKKITHHDGMDFTASIGTPIYATADGTIEKSAYDRGGYGKHVIINHGYGYKTLYAHMNEFKTKRGAKVKRLDIIGYVGNTGLSLGPHLHYEVHHNGTKENPSYYYHADLSPDDYSRLIELSSKENQSFD